MDNKGRIYWFTGQSGAGKTVLATKLKEFLQTEKRNWRKDVFQIDGDIVRELTKNQDQSEVGQIENIKDTQLIAEYIHNSGSDVVVSMVTPYKELREGFKAQIGDKIVEIYVYTTKKKLVPTTSDYEVPEENFFEINTTSDNPTQSFSKLINYLKDIDKL
jgi:adenylylsulfate kinase-like enzyme